MNKRRDFRVKDGSPGKAPPMAMPAHPSKNAFFYGENRAILAHPAQFRAGPLTYALNTLPCRGTHPEVPRILP